MNKIYSALRLGLIMTLVILISVYVYNAYVNYFLWYDEAGQFYIAKGLNHYSAPYSAYSLNIVDLIQSNRYFNMDPGGYSILLYFWTMMDNSSQWMRLLSMLFFFISVFYIYRLGVKLFGNRDYAIILASIFIVADPFPFIADLIRAYSMEMLGVVISLYFLQKIKESLEIRQLLTLAIIMDVFMTSRYSFVVYSFSLALYVSYLCVTKVGFKASIIRLVLFLSVLLAGVIFVFFIAMHYQNSHANKLWYLDYLGSNMGLLSSWLSIRFYIVVFYVLWSLLRKRSMEAIPIITLITSVIFFMLSLANMYPWETQRVLPLPILQYITIGIIIVDVLKDNQLKKSLCLLMACVFMIHKSYALVYSPVVLPEQEAFEEFVAVVKTLKPEEKIYVSSMQPDIRFQFEEGVYKNKYSAIYPAKMVFAAGRSHAMRESIVVGNKVKPEETNCRYVLFLETSKADTIKFQRVKPYQYIYEQKKNKYETSCVSNSGS